MQHSQYGKQFEACSLEFLPPSTQEGMEKFLASGLLRGVGPSTAKKLMAAFGERVFQVMEHSPQDLQSIPGIGPAKGEKIAQSYKEHQHVQRLMVFLQSYGIGLALGLKLYRTYGEEAIRILQHQPYRLATDVSGIGFRTADKIAKTLGIPHDSPERIRAGIAYLLQQALDDGHVCMPFDSLFAKVRTELQVPHLHADEAFSLMQQIKELAVERDATGRLSVYLRPYLAMEEYVAQWFFDKIQGPGQGFAGAECIQHDQSVESLLSSEQMQAVTEAFSTPVLILTGGPGTGKTTTIRAILQVALQLGWQTVLAAPTGRAAKRLTETTGAPAKTIHRLLEYGQVEGAGGQFARHANHPLDGDLFIIDEVSMLDLQMFYYLLRALPPHGRLLLVGDQNQLPSVGPGQILKDLLDSKTVPSVTLTTVFRQAQASLIVENAYRVLHGQMIRKGGREDNCFFLPVHDLDQMEQLLLELVRTRLPAFLQLDDPYDSYEHIQVLAPMRKGRFGVERFNHLLQEAINPFAHGKREIRAQGITFRIGDKVLQTKNEYEKDVFNGDIGRIVDVDAEDGRMTVLFPDQRTVEYEQHEFDMLQHAYAMTIHKSQGSEYPIVILPMVMEHAILLQRQMFYTALTRARRLAVIVGQEAAVKRAIATSKIAHRYTNLAERLRREC
ncbi:ATP-dependent RecD-like DNA helicase [Fodinisporobacter ferrooxydans]|uniref:ATP-dependent RecD2 DNA helicase n=1 Tax=Fodinisporobacter ferrooxydans TaxID=2901836 RepID=A0ABY4CLU1_9BACL|nr:ATP-dependent RecD-like DNA helicase [Alicyclobacillaceae bacterium MYW30-H2]